MTPSPRAAITSSLTAIVQDGALLSQTQISPSIALLFESQPALESQLRRADAQLEKIKVSTERVSLDPQTSARMEQTREVLKRTKRKLAVIRGRLGRLREYEESDKLMLMERKMTDFGGKDEQGGANSGSDGLSH